MHKDLTLILQQWQLSNVRSFEHIVMPNNYVVKAYSCEYETDVVLKIGSKSLIERELQALQYFQGDACVKLLKFDQEDLQDQSALLLEYVQPGTTLKDLYLQGKEDQSIQIFVDVLKEMHIHTQKSADHKFEYVQTAGQRLQLLHHFQSNNDKLMSLLPLAAVLADQLIQSQGQQYFLHGDLHHENILKKGDSWVMIDPQGVVGELEYEVGAFIRNPLFELLDYSDLEKLMKARFDLLSSLLQLDRQRIIAWAFVQTVLAACFTEQNNNDVGQHYFITVAEMIKQFVTF